MQNNIELCLERRVCDFNNIKMLLEGGGKLSVEPVTLNSQNKSGNSMLHIAALSGNIKLAKLLLNYGALTETRNEKGNTPLLESLEKGNLEVATLLINKNASLQVKNNKGLNSLMLLANRTRGLNEEALIEIASKIISAGVDINTTSNDLFHALMNIVRYPRLYDFIIQQVDNMDVNKLVMGRQPLYFHLAEELPLQKVKDLFRFKPDVNLRNTYGDSILHVLANTSVGAVTKAKNTVVVN